MTQTSSKTTLTQIGGALPDRRRGDTASQLGVNDLYDRHRVWLSDNSVELVTAHTPGLLSALVKIAPDMAGFEIPGTFSSRWLVTARHQAGLEGSRGHHIEMRYGSADTPKRAAVVLRMGSLANTLDVSVSADTPLPVTGTANLAQFPAVLEAVGADLHSIMHNGTAR